MEAIRFDSVSKYFGGVKALHNITFQVKVGERLGIIGPNGAGKTTLINVLNGQLFPTLGRIHFFGQDITSMPTNQRIHLGIGRSFQITSLFPKLTILDSALLALHGTQPSRFHMFRSVKDYPDIMAEVRKLLETWNLWGQKDKPVAGISYGDQRKLEIVLGIASKPRLLLLDEPSNGLTAAESAEIVSMISNLELHITVIVIAHDMDLIFGLAQRIIVLHYGEMIADGTIDEIQADPRVKGIYMGLGGPVLGAKIN